MRRVGCVNLTIALVFSLLTGFVLLSPGLGSRALDFEKGFIAGLHNSLYYLDQAKQQWAEEKSKSELDTPTLLDLMGYLGDWKDSVERFRALGIDYAITSMAEPQSDVATLTRDLSFRRGFCRFYPAGTSLRLRGGWSRPTEFSTTSSLRSIYIYNRHLLAAALFLLAIFVARAQLLTA